MPLTCAEAEAIIEAHHKQKASPPQASSGEFTFGPLLANLESRLDQLIATLAPAGEGVFAKVLCCLFIFTIHYGHAFCTNDKPSSHGTYTYFQTYFRSHNTHI